MPRAIEREVGSDALEKPTRGRGQRRINGNTILQVDVDGEFGPDKIGVAGG